MTPVIFMTLIDVAYICKKAALFKLDCGEKSCEIQAKGREMAVMVAFVKTRTGLDRTGPKVNSSRSLLNTKN